MKNDSEPDDGEKPIAGQLTYFNILAQSIQNINTSIMQDKDARDAAENLLSDLPDDWLTEVHDELLELETNYNNKITDSNKKLIKGNPESMKQAARKEIYLAGKNYSRNVKNLVISLLEKKHLLYQTRNKAEVGFYLKDDDVE